MVLGGGDELAKRGYNVTVENEIREAYVEYCKKNGLKQSQLIESFMKDVVEDKYEFQTEFKMQLKKIN